MAGRFGFHSGIMRCQDAKVKGDLYVQDDIIFSDVSAGVLGVTGGIDMQTTTAAIGIDMGGTFSTSAINIDGTCANNAVAITYTASATEALALTVATTKTITTGMSFSGAGTWTTGILLDATAIGTGISISAGSLTDGIKISGTTPVDGIEISSACSANGINVSGACADGIEIGGACTANALHIAGDQATGILLDVDAAWTNGISMSVDDGITCTAGISLGRTGTTGICTTGIMIDTDGTTALWIGDGFTGTTEILLAGTATNAISVTGASTTAISLSGDATTGIDITSGMSATNVIAIAATASTAGINITGNCTNGINIEAQTTSAITFGVSDGYIVDAAASTTYYGGNTTGDALVLYGSSADGQKITITGAGNIDCVTATYTVTPAAAGSAVFKLASDANAYTEFTQADGAGLTVNCTSDGTASVTFSDNVILSTGVISGIKDVVTMGIGRVTALNFPYNNVTQTEATAAFAKVADSGVFGNLSAVNVGYSSTYQLFPDAEGVDDAVYFGAASKFGAIYMDNGTPAVYGVAASHITWEYWGASGWVPLTILWDQTDTTANNGLKPFQADGYILFSAPTDWAAIIVDTQLAYWIRARCNATVDITTIPINNSVNHKTVAFDAGTRVPYAGTVGRGRFQFQTASTGTNDTKVILYNGTSGAASVIKTVTKAKIDVAISDFALTVAANDIVGFFVTQVDGGGVEYAGGTCELEVTRTV